MHVSVQPHSIVHFLPILFALYMLTGAEQNIAYIGNVPIKAAWSVSILIGKVLFVDIMSATAVDVQPVPMPSDKLLNVAKLLHAYVSHNNDSI